MAGQAYQIAFAGEAVTEEFYGIVTSLTVEESTASAGTLELRLATQRDANGAWALLDDSRLNLFTAVSVKAGFSGNDGLEPVFDGYITSVNLDLQSDPGKTFIQVQAMDSSVLLSLEEKVA